MAASVSDAAPRPRRIRLGTIHADEVTTAGALERIERALTGGTGGFVVTPNVDHLCLAEVDLRLRAAYGDALLSLVDGTPLMWLARSMGNPFPEKISGSDFIGPLMARAAERAWGVYFLGGRPEVGPVAAERLREQYPGLRIVGMDAPPLGFEQDPVLGQAVLDRISAARPHLLLVALGCPKQELWMHQHRAAYAPAVALGIGATLDFVAGVVRRAPRWMSRVGLEWVYRLAQEPGRMAQRYLVRDRAILGIVWRMWRWPASRRTFLG